MSRSENLQAQTVTSHPIQIKSKLTEGIHYHLFPLLLRITNVIWTESSELRIFGRIFLPILVRIDIDIDND